MIDMPPNHGLCITCNDGTLKPVTDKRCNLHYWQYQQSLKSAKDSPKENKYRNKPVVIDGIKFQSTKEGNYYLYLKGEKQIGVVTNFRMQVKYPLLVNKLLVCSYKADFVVEYVDGTTSVIDVKGFRTDVYRIKRALMIACWGITIKEV